jgi:hypothetical protein
MWEIQLWIVKEASSMLLPLWRQDHLLFSSSVLAFFPSTKLDYSSSKLHMDGSNQLSLHAHEWQQ